MSSPKNTPKTEKRIDERVPTELRTIVQVRQSETESWKEITDVSTVSRSGAGFTLSRECTVGHLITLVLPLPPELRAYDKAEELYPVMGLVQYCNRVTVSDETVFHIGVGFVGNQIPDSYKANPSQGYRITGVQENGLWQITEAESPFKPRKNPRMWVSEKVSIILIKKDRSEKDRNENYRENTVTQNISLNGMSVECSLDADVGDRVKITCKAHDFYSLANVRNRKLTTGRPATLHLEFVNNKFPMDKLYAARNQAHEATRSAAQVAEDVKAAIAEQADPPLPPPPDTHSPGTFEFSRY